jgi:hypothetical protein
MSQFNLEDSKSLRRCFIKTHISVQKYVVEEHWTDSNVDLALHITIEQILRHRTVASLIDIGRVWLAIPFASDQTLKKLFLHSNEKKS